MNTIITNYIRAGYSGIDIISNEEARVEAEIKAICSSLNHQLYAWSITDGIVCVATGAVKKADDPLMAMVHAAELPENSVLLLRDFHQFLEDGNPVLVRTLKELVRDGKSKARTLIVLGCRLCLPPELQREFVVVEFALPTKAELTPVLNGIIDSAELPALTGEQRDVVLEAATGLTTVEAENAFALSVVETGSISAAIIAREKAQAVKKGGILELIDDHASLNDIGGLDGLKSWLLKRREAFTQSARQYRLPTPKGLLILGIPGTGKSLTAKATASVFKTPLLRLDGGRLFGSLVGQSEANLRSALAMAEAIAPCVLWIDELEKAFAGSKSSGTSDGGTSARVFGSFINWLQEKQSPVFVVATANDVSQLPAELLRKGRFDELFFVDLPTREEREAIWSLQIQKYGRNPKDFDIVQLAKITEGFTGAEVEQVVVEALFHAFEEGTEPTDLTVATVLTETVPLSTLMADSVASLRQWAKGRTRLATSQPVELKRRKFTT